MATEFLFLAIAAFLAATLIPVSSEIVFTGYLALGYSKSACLIVASLGNCLGLQSIILLEWLGYSPPENIWD